MKLVCSTPDTSHGSAWYSSSLSLVEVLLLRDLRIAVGFSWLHQVGSSCSFPDFWNRTVVFHSQENVPVPCQPLCAHPIINQYKI